MYVDVIDVEASGSYSDRAISRSVRAALRLLEHQLQLVRVELQAAGGRQSCRLSAWSALGRKWVVESCAASVADAIEAATGGLNRALSCGDSQRWDSLLRAARRRDRASEAAQAVVARAGRVLVAVHALDPCAASLYWANVLASGLGADLVRHVIGSAVLSVREGRLHREAVRAPEVIGRKPYVDWIVVPASDGCGVLAAALARSAGCPVLVSRAPTTRPNLLVATEVGRNDNHVLESAARVAQALQAPLPALRDGLGSASPEAWQAGALADCWTDLRRQLRELGAEPPPELDVLLAHGGGRVEAILEQARKADAEMIIVGLGPEAESPVDRVAAAVAERSVRSVLIVPWAATPLDIQRPKRAQRLRSIRPLASGVAMEARCTESGTRRRFATARRRWRGHGAWPGWLAATHRR